MIVRVFRCTVAAGRERDWQDRVEKISIPWLQSLGGLVAFYPGRPLGDSGDRAFCMVMIFDRIESIKAAMGDAWKNPVLLEDEALLVERAEVDHFELFPPRSGD